jgi:hypothetical protein
MSLCRFSCPQVVIVDVRPKDEYESGHIPQARHFCRECEDCSSNVNSMMLAVDSAVNQRSLSLDNTPISLICSTHGDIRHNSVRFHPQQGPATTMIVVYDSDEEGRSSHVANFMSQNLRPGEVSQSHFKSAGYFVENLCRLAIQTASCHVSWYCPVEC